MSAAGILHPTQSEMDSLERDFADSGLDESGTQHSF